MESGPQTRVQERHQGASLQNEDYPETNKDLQGQHNRPAEVEGSSETRAGCIKGSKAVVLGTVWGEWYDLSRLIGE